MSQFFQRLAHYLATEIVTKRLANSQTFMTAAHKTHQNVQKSHKMLKEGQSAAVEHSKTFSGFFKEFRQELARELTGKGGK